MTFIKIIKIPTNRKLAFLRELNIFEWEECLIKLRDKTKSLTLKKELTLCCSLVRYAIDCNATKFTIMNGTGSFLLTFEFKTEDDLYEFNKKYPEMVVSP